MQLLTNEIEPDAVSRQVEDGTEYLTAPVVMAKAMPLNGGYLPQSEIEASADKWNGIDVPIGHPAKNGQAVSVDSDHDNPVIGEVRNATAEGERLLGELWLNIKKAKQAGTEGVQVLSRLASGDPLEVSTAYIPNTVEENAEADGKPRRKVVRDIEPDHLAVLPNEKGKCSIADGCGAPRVNQLMVPMTDDGDTPEDMDQTTAMHGNQNVTYEVTDVTPEDVSGYTDREWDGSEVVSELPNPSESEEAASILDETHMLVPQDDEARDSKSNWKLPFRAGADEPVNTRALVAIDAALSGARGGVEGVDSDTKEAAANLTEAFLVDAPGDLFGSLDAEETETNANAIERFVNRVASVWQSDDNEEAESSTDTTANMSRDTDAHDYLVNEHGYDRENLPPAGSDCIEKMEQNHRQLDDMTSDGDSESDPETNADNDLDAKVEAKVEEILATNEQSDLVDDILANTDEYDPETLEQTPETVLREIHDNVTRVSAVNMPANTGRKSVNTDDEYSGPTDFGEYITEAE